MARSALGVVLTLQIALLACVALPADAYADVRKSDIIAGISVEDRDLSVADCPSVTATYAALATPDGSIYFNRNGDDATEIASITKVMTAIVALDHADDSLRIIVSEAAAEVGESTADLHAGDVMDLSTALKALLVPSGNDAAIAIAETVGEFILQENPSIAEDATGAFVAAMNQKATELGLEDTLYENPHGLDDDEWVGDLHSTAFDQLKVAACAMTYPEIRDIVKGGSTSIQVTRDGKPETVELETTDALLERYDYTIGIKTGMTDLAGPSFMGAANKDGAELYAVVLDAEDDWSRFEDAKALFEWGYEHIVDVSLANSDEWATMRVDGESKQVPVIGEASHYEWLDRTVKATLADPEATVNVFDLEGNVTQTVAFDEIHGTVNAGDKIGTITFKQQNEVVATQDLVACERVEAPNPLDTFVIWWQRVTQGLDDTTGRAQSKVYNVMPVIYDYSTITAS